MFVVCLPLHLNILTTLNFLGPLLFPFSSAEKAILGNHHRKIKTKEREETIEFSKEDSKGNIKSVFFEKPKISFKP
ncbi:hypothetical protein RJT34_10354 [Clitoria ternatea]|uniref:Cyclotide n=1 Tax=Clitoria ternatea TaxID=43366 RepID=A0AAN9K8B8_CLITE